jgi:hypothetical protein
MEFPWKARRVNNEKEIPKDRIKISKEFSKG